MGVLFVLLLVGPSVTLCTPLGAQQPPPTCSRASLEAPPTWTWNGAWSQDGSQLLLVDVRTGAIQVYDTEGTLVERVRRPGAGPLDFNRPNTIVATENGFLLKDASNHFVFLDEDLIPQHGLNTGEIDPGVQGMPRAFFDWTVAGGRLYGLGDIRTADGSWDSGWLEMDLEDPHRNRVFRPPPAREGPHRLYRLGYPYAAAEGERVYLLLMGAEGVGILQVAPKIRKLRAFPEGFDSLPHPPDFDSGRRTHLVFRFLQDATYPTGLFAWGGRLFVLTRTPADGQDGSTRWELHAIDPAKDTLEETRVLPTGAAHLSVIPGPVRWALVEKEPVERRQGVAHQTIDRVTFLASRLFRQPTAWIETPCPPREPAADE